MTSKPFLALAFGATALTGLAGCAMNPIPTEVPNAQTIAGIEPSGRVIMTEVFAGGGGVGTGALTFKGKTYPFKLVGTVVGRRRRREARRRGRCLQARRRQGVLGRPTARARAESGSKLRARATCGSKTRPASSCT